MYLLYVDESGDPGPQGSRFLLLGAAALFEGKWRFVEQEIRSLINRYFPALPRPAEIHFAPLRKGRDEYRALSREQRVNLRSDFCSIVRGLRPNELVLFTVVADKTWWFQQNPGKTGDDLYAELFENLSSRFDLFLKRRHAKGQTNKGIIIADPHKPALCESLKRNQKRFQRHGHRWGPLYNLIETVFFLDSSESPGLQIADLCSYGMWRLILEDDDSHVEPIASSFDHESSAPGGIRWHGITFLGDDPAIEGRIRRVWN